MADKVTAEKVQDDNRMDFLPRHVGVRNILFFENMVYSYMDRASSDYGGGSWDFYDLDNGGFYMAPDHDGPFAMSWEDNFFEGDMTPDAAGVAITLMALGHLAFDSSAGEHFYKKFHQLRAFALDHPEASQIFGFID